MASDRLARQLLNMTTDPNVADPVKLAAIKDALDRGGVSAKTAVEVEVSTKTGTVAALLVAGMPASLIYGPMRHRITRRGSAGRSDWTSRLVNGFVNETRHNCPYGVERAVMACMDVVLAVACTFETPASTRPCHGLAYDREFAARLAAAESLAPHHLYRSACAKCDRPGPIVGNPRPASMQTLVN